MPTSHRQFARVSELSLESESTTEARAELREVTKADHTVAIAVQLDKEPVVCRGFSKTAAEQREFAQGNRAITADIAIESEEAINRFVTEDEFAARSCIPVSIELITAGHSRHFRAIDPKDIVAVTKHAAGGLRSAEP